MLRRVGSGLILAASREPLNRDPSETVFYPTQWPDILPGPCNSNVLIDVKDAGD